MRSHFHLCIISGSAKKQKRIYLSLHLLDCLNFDTENGVAMVGEIVEDISIFFSLKKIKKGNWGE
jgi:hypothetical protein